MVTSFGPDDFFSYVYSVFHSPTYRERYKGALNSDFPRVPLNIDRSLFAKLVPSGRDLVTVHLLEFPNSQNESISLVGTGKFRVEKVSYSDETIWIDKGKSLGFRGISERVWDFNIGAYKVCEKWLKDRQAKGGKNPRPRRVLTRTDIDHYRRIVAALNETIRIMEEIDGIIDQHGGWPDAFQCEAIGSSSGSQPGP